MTAICGVVSGRPRSDNERDCRAGVEAQSLYWRRKPEIQSVAGASFAAALFETTPEDLNDRQPLRSGSVLLVSDARIDNRDELLSALSPSPLQRNSPASEIILAGWSRWGVALFDRLIGSFAIAIFDSESGQAILARGPSSDRPLCYRVDGESLHFSSVPSGVLAGRSFAPNLTALAHLIVQGDYAPGETSFAEVRTVAPGQYLEWRGGLLRQVRFWHPPQVDPSITGSVVEEFRHLLDQSVACRMRRIEGPVATHLSSGFDSSAITATAARIDRENVLAFTMLPAPGVPLSVPRNYKPDESAAAAETAAMLGIRHQLVCHSRPLLDELRGHSRFYQVPVPNVPNHGWGIEIQKSASAAGAHVLLSGVVGNATISFGGIGVLSEWLQQRRYLAYLAQVRALVRTGAARWRGAIFYSVDRYLPRQLRFALYGSLPADAARLFIAPRWLQQVEGDVIPPLCDTPGVRESQYQIYAGGGDDGIFLKGTLARFGVDERDASSDRRLIDFALRLPAEQYLNNGVTRRLAREGLSDRLPPAILRHKVRGYQGADWFAKFRADQALAWIEEISASPSASELLDLKQMRADIERLPEIAALDPGRLRQWGHRFTRALAVGAFLRECEQDFELIGRR